MPQRGESVVSMRPSQNSETSPTRSAWPPHVTVSTLNEAAVDTAAMVKPRSAPEVCTRLPPGRTDMVASRPSKAIRSSSEAMASNGVATTSTDVPPSKPTSAATRATSSMPASSWNVCSSGMAFASTTSSALPQPIPERSPAITGPWRNVIPRGSVACVAATSAPLSSLARYSATTVTLAVLVNQPTSQSWKETATRRSGPNESAMAFSRGSRRSRARAPNTGGRPRAAARTTIPAAITSRLTMAKPKRIGPQRYVCDGHGATAGQPRTPRNP